MQHRPFAVRGGFVAGLALACAFAPVPLAAQQNDGEEEARAALVRADSLRATLVQPPGSKRPSAASLVRAPFKAFGFALTVVGAVGYLGYQALDETGALHLLGQANRDLEALGVKVRPRYVGSRSGIALGARWRGGPLFLEGGYSIRGYALARGGLIFGDTLHGLELSATHHAMQQLHFWGVGPDASLANESDYAHVQRELGGVARVRLLPHVRVEAGGAWEQNDAHRGNDPVAPDVQDQFAGALPFGALGVDRFARADAALDLDFTWIAGPFQLHGARLVTQWSGYRGIDGTDADFQLATSDLRVFLPLSDRHAFALRGLAADAFGEKGAGVPLYHLAALGGDHGLRGQKSWRLRDRALLSGMAEWRYQVWWHPGDPIYRLDGFVFVDHGAVGPSLDAIRREDFTTTPGVGIRFMNRGIGSVETFLAFGGDKPRVGFGLGASF